MIVSNINDSTFYCGDELERSKQSMCDLIPCSILFLTQCCASLVRFAWVCAWCVSRSSNIRISFVHPYVCQPRHTTQTLRKRRVGTSFQKEGQVGGHLSRSAALRHRIEENTLMANDWNIGGMLPSFPHLVDEVDAASFSLGLQYY